MSKKKIYAVFGLGRYGMAVARELVSHGAEVIAVDMDERIVNAAADEIPICKCADVTDPDVLRQLGIANVDVVIIAMANSFEASVMAITLCKEMGVKTVIAKSANTMHQKILARIGADTTVFPENESGIRLAKNLLSSGFVDMISLSKNVSMMEVEVQPEWVGKNLIELNLRKKYSINIVAIRREDSVRIEVDPTELLEKEDNLIVIANPEKLARINL